MIRLILTILGDANSKLAYVIKHEGGDGNCDQFHKKQMNAIQRVMQEVVVKPVNRIDACV
jgi:hypothetical protein